ncbi:MAG TPA: GNAT family N-acetyltransferase [Mycobacteriales bacterium]|nr:GNAT family N-acetyltransferase [Mycobacteriales bacterium]
MNLAERLAADYCDWLRAYGERAEGRFAVQVAGLTLVSLGVDEPWGLQLLAMPSPPDARAVPEAVAWCRGELRREPSVMVRAADRASLSTYRVVDEMPALVAPSGGDQHVLEIEVTDDADEFRDLYAATFEMPREPSAALVVGADVGPHRHLVGRVGGRAVACAQVRPGPELAYVNGVGVLPAERGHGYGAAMMTACRVEARVHGCELVWLNASPTSVGFYEAIGFELVDTHVALAAPSSAERT